VQEETIRLRRAGQDDSPVFTGCPLHVGNSLADHCRMAWQPAKYGRDASSPYMANQLKVLLGVPEPLERYPIIRLGMPAEPILPAAAAGSATETDPLRTTT